MNKPPTFDTIENLGDFREGHHFLTKATALSKEEVFYGVFRPEGRELEVMRLAKENWEHGFVAKSDLTHWITLFFIRDGNGWIDIADTRHELKAGDIVLHCPPRPLTLMGSHAGVALNLSVIACSGIKVTGLLEPGVGLNTQVLHLMEFGIVWEVLDLILKIGLEGGISARSIIEALIPPLLLALQQSASPAQSKASPTRNLFEKCRHYICQNISKGLTVESVANDCHLSATHLYRLFMEYEKCSTQRYIAEFKMRYAASLLLESGSSIESIAGQLGYADSFTFSKAFSRSLGVSPSEFRKKALTLSPIAMDKRQGRVEN